MFQISSVVDFVQIPNLHFKTVLAYYAFLSVSAPGGSCLLQGISVLSVCQRADFSLADKRGASQAHFKFPIIWEKNY
jgi:hypothetical protein